MRMEAFNQSLFLLINAPASANAIVLAFAIFFAEYVILSIPAGFIWAWISGQEKTRKQLLQSCIAVGVALTINQVIGLIFQHPRPFMIGLGHDYLLHAADSSLPSDHLTVVWTIAACWLFAQGGRRVGVALALIGLPMAWARIYLGVHFPLDMVGAAVVAASSAWLCRCYAPPLTDRLFPIAQKSYRRLFAPLIRRRWMAD